MIETARVTEHFTRDGLTERLRTALAAAGLGERVSAEQLAPLDQFHSRGLEATIEMAGLLKPTRETKVLDIGAGLGGPSRYLAQTYGCSVTGIDLSPSYVEAAGFLAERSGLSEMVTYQCADALALPFADEQFDLVWTQHVAMNIADRAAFYAEAWRVMKPGAKLAVYDVVAGNGDPAIYPVPWSSSPEASSLMTGAEMRIALEAQEFLILSWKDRSAEGIAWFADLQKRQATAEPVPSPIGLHLAMGPEFKTMTANLGRNLQEGRVILVEAIAWRAGIFSR